MKHLKSPVYISILVFFLYLPLQAMAGDATASNMEGLNNGQLAFNQGNYALSFALWQKEALQGNSDAQVFVGLSYANGWGVRKDMHQASIWYAKAAQNNNPSGQLLLGLYYFLESEHDRAAGLTWLTLAAEGGDAQARHFLEKGYAKGWFNDITPVMPRNKPDHSPFGPIALADSLY